MQGITQTTEKPGFYGEKVTAIKKQMMRNSKLSKKYSEAEIEVMIKNSLIREALDKIEFSLRGAVRKNNLRKINKQREVLGQPPLDDEEFEKMWRKNIRKQLEDAGFPFELKEKEIEILSAIEERGKLESADEIKNIASEAMKKLLQTV